jgi:spore maturation protein CgeB
VSHRDALLDAISKTHPIKRDIFVIGEDMVRSLSSYKIAFNCNIADDINYRTFEATAAGAMLLTNYTPNLEKLFDIGKEIIAYRSLDEILSFINYYTNNDDERNTIARAGMNRTVACHSYNVRAEQLIEHLKRLG